MHNPESIPSETVENPKSAGSQREVFGWGMYDWANSAFSTIVVTTFLGPYLTALAEANGGTVNLLGYPLEGAGFYPLCVSISGWGLQVFVPAHSGRHCRLLLILEKTPDAGLCLPRRNCDPILLFLVTSDLILLGGLLFIIANLSFGAHPCLFTMPSYPILPVRMSAMRSAQRVCPGLCRRRIGPAADPGLALVGQRGKIEVSRAGSAWPAPTYGGWSLPSSFPSAAWWRDPAHRLPPGETYLTHSFQTVRPHAKRAFLQIPHHACASDCLFGLQRWDQTINTVATIFASSELGLSTSTLVQVVLMIHL